MRPCSQLGARLVRPRAHASERRRAVGARCFAWCGDQRAATPLGAIPLVLLGRRRGFALIAVLWAVVGIAALALAAELAARDAAAAARNRLAATRARWRAEGCLERARSGIDAALGREGPDAVVPGAWAALDHLVPDLPLVRSGGCVLQVVPAGAVLDVNSADGEKLRRLFAAAGVRSGVDSLADAILDWRDADDVARPSGAERAWYRAERAPVPRNGPLASISELRLVRGLSGVKGLDTLLGAEPGRVVLARAPRAVLAALPGMTSESVEEIVELRGRGVRAIDPALLGSALSRSERDSLLAGFPELSRRTVPEPDAWVVTARAVGADSATAALEVRLVRAGTRAAIVRRRSW